MWTFLKQNHNCFTGYKNILDLKSNIGYESWEMKWTEMRKSEWKNAKNCSLICCSPRHTSLDVTPVEFNVAYFWTDIYRIALWMKLGFIFTYELSASWNIHCLTPIPYVIKIKKRCCNSIWHIWYNALQVRMTEYDSLLV